MLIFWSPTAQFIWEAGSLVRVQPSILIYASADAPPTEKQPTYKGVRNIFAQNMDRLQINVMEM